MMFSYINYGKATKTYYGIDFPPQTVVHDVPGYVNDAEIIRVFDDPEIEAKHKIVFVAVFRISFYNWDNTLISTGLYPAGTILTPAVPEKPEDEEYTYTFAGWSPTLVPVEANATYLATFTPVPKANPYLTFWCPNEFSIYLYEAAPDGTLEYSTDAETWTEWTDPVSDRIYAAEGADENYYFYLRGTNNTTFATASGNRFLVVNADNGLHVDGNIEMILDYQSASRGEHPVMAEGCFKGLFESAPIVSAPDLPATTLSVSCYETMFGGCTLLEVAPALPATTLAASCYLEMFSGCIALTTPPALPATTLATSCYAYMFYNCEALTTPPALPATTLAEGCYASMFVYCRALQSFPDLPATVLPDSCYANMFEDFSISDTQDQDYTVPFRIPSTGTVTSYEEYSLYTMFSYSDDILPNTTYYIQLLN